MYVDLIKKPKICLFSLVVSHSVLYSPQPGIGRGRERGRDLNAGRVRERGGNSSPVPAYPIFYLDAHLISKVVSNLKSIPSLLHLLESVRADSGSEFGSSHLLSP